MMRSQATKILAEMAPVTAQTIKIPDIDAALLCHDDAIYDLDLRWQLVQACDDLRADRRSTPNVASAVRAVQQMLAKRDRARQEAL